MKKLLLLVSIFFLSCNSENDHTNNSDSVVVDVPVISEDTISVPEEASDSMKDARIKAKDSIKTSLGK
jgi:hypothetical protein